MKKRSTRPELNSGVGGGSLSEPTMALMQMRVADLGACRLLRIAREQP